MAVLYKEQPNKWMDQSPDLQQHTGYAAEVPQGAFTHIVLLCSFCPKLHGQFIFYPFPDF